MVDVSRGVDMFEADVDRIAQLEAERAMSVLPDFESALVKSLMDPSHVYWVSDSTPSEVNSLVEYPLGTVVLVIKPAGSSIELEIKRAGIRGIHPLTVVYSRDGKVVPPSHHIQGGSMGNLLRFEAASSSTLANIHRLVFGAEAPIPAIVSLVSIYSLPGRQPDGHIMDYFTDPTFFGPGYGEMRAAMSPSISRLDRTSAPIQPATDLAVTAAFLGKVEPSQAILAGTTSFRLDRLAAYLGDEGADAYFTVGLGCEFTRPEARRFADDLLEEILGCYKPPAANYASHKQYIQAALVVPENRARANANYLSNMSEIGRFWGLIMAVGGFSDGESFVARNVGLKSSWSKARWTTKIIFMDHDGLNLPNRRHYDFHPRRIVSGMWSDAKRIFGYHSPDRCIEGDIELLDRIYRVDADTAFWGRRKLKGSLKRAYQRTLREMTTNPDFRRYLPLSFAEQRLVWD
ncbi:MAG: hypothetical protein ACREDA_09680, partial [Methylocella sp.]